MPSLRIHAATWHTNIAQEQLQHRGRVNQLHRMAMMSPAECIENRTARSGVPVEQMIRAERRKSSTLQPQMEATFSGVYLEKCCFIN